MTDAVSIEVVEETGSTNADLLNRLAQNEALPEGYWLRAERQNSGRGRLGRKWDSRSGNLMCSTVVNLAKDDHLPATLSLVTGLAVFDAIQMYVGDDAPILLKWPNDVLLMDAKAAGILLERQGQSIVAGIGINVAYAPQLPDRETICLSDANAAFSGGPDTVLKTLADAFARRLAQWREQPLSHTLMEWGIRSHRFNDKLRITGSDGEVLQARYRGIDGEGALKVQPLGANETIVHAGDVTLKWHDED